MEYPNEHLKGISPISEDISYMGTSYSNQKKKQKDTLDNRNNVTTYICQTDRRRDNIAYFSSQNSLLMNHLLERVSFTRRNRVVEGFTKRNFRRDHATYFLTKCRTTQPTCGTKNKKLSERWL